MRINSLGSVRAVAACALVAIFVPTAFAYRGDFVPLWQEKEKPAVSEGESKAAQAVESAPNAGAKLTAAEEFVKKYPKSTIRDQVTRYVADQIAEVSDAGQKLELAQQYERVFTAEPDLAIIRPIMLDAYVAANRIDDAFKLGTAVLAKDPEDTHVLILLTIAGTEEAKRGKTTYVAQSLQYGVKVIELIEANKKPTWMNDAAWESHKTMLPRLYQQTAALQMISGKPAEAKTRLEKSIALDPKEPSGYVLLGYVLNDDYIQLATNYKAMPEGAEKAALMKKIEGMMDNMIDLYARAVALATGRQEYQSLIQQVMPDLTSFYKYRHQSTDGLQQLIDKYKATSTP